MFIIIIGNSSVLSKPGYSTRGSKTTNASKILIDMKLFNVYYYYYR